jgi:hypothetical protein
LKTIVIEHDDSGMASGWFLESVEVKDKNQTTMSVVNELKCSAMIYLSIRFPVGRWLDKDEDDGRISLELEPNKKPTSKKTAGSF